MSPAPSKSGTKKSGKAWRTKSASSRSIQHQWQVRGELGNRGTFRRSWRRIMFLWGIVAGLLLTLVLFAYLVLFAPQKTPLLMMVSLDYAWPYGPNCWAEEDLQRFKSLNGRNLELYPVGEDQMRRAEWLTDFSRKLVNAEFQHSGNQPILIYVSMHGSVDADGNPCLIPPNSSPVDTSTWIPVSELLKEIKRLELNLEQPVMLFMDCNKRITNWDRGLVYNSFAVALANTVRDAAMPNLFVLNSTSSGQQSNFSEGLQGSIFGDSVARALSGEADLTRNQGNGDRQLQLSEIMSFVESRVSNWSLKSRGQRQTPMLTPDHGNNVSLGWAISDLKIASPPNRSGDRVSLAIENLYELWQSYEQVSRSDLLRLSPIATTRFIQDLCWCEKALISGNYYLTRVEEKLLTLKKQFSQIQQGITYQNAKNKGDAWKSTPGPIGHTVALNQYFGRADATTLSFVQTLDELIQNYTASALAEFLKNAPPEFDQFVDIRFLKIVQQMADEQTISNRELMTTVLKTQQQCRNLALLPDQRILSRIETAWGPIEKRRRQLEDDLLVGKGSLSDWQKLQATIDDFELYVNKLGGFYALSDQAQADIPFYARWLADASHLDSLFKHHIELAEQLLAPALNANLQLQQFLNENPGENIALDQERLQTTAQGLTLLLSKLQQSFTGEATLETAEAAWVIENFKANQGLLHVPILFPVNNEDKLSGAQQRKALYLITRRMSKHFESQAPIQITKITPQADPILKGASQNDSLRSLLETTKNLIRDLVASAKDFQQFEDESNTERSIENFESFIRLVLESYPEKNRLQIEESRTHGKDVRTLLTQAASRSRQLASYWHPHLESSAVDELLKFDSSNFIMWQLELVLDDFLGGATAINPPFFQQAAHHYLDYFNHLHLMDVELTLDRKQLQELLNQRVLAAQNGLKLTGTRSLVIDGNVFGSFEIDLQSGSRTAFQALPDMQGQLVIVEDKMPCTAPQSAKINSSLQTNSQVHQFELGTDLTLHAKAAKQVQGLFQFRGHEIFTPLDVTMPAGQQADIYYPTSLHADVTVIDNQANPISVMIVLDCSQSMNANIPWESSGKELTKFNAAMAATGQILNSLANLPEARVGLVLYGHRVGWNTASPTQILRQTKYALPIPDVLYPYEDYEIVLPFGRFGKSEDASLQKILQTVQPWGETPLYLSIQSALREMNSKSLGGKQQIIVITDGINKQLNPSADKYVSLSTLLNEDFGQTAVNIVGFGIEAADSQTAASEFEQLASRTGGEYLEINDAGSLLQKASGYFNKQEYTVSAGEQTFVDQKSFSQPAGQPVRLDIEFNQRIPASVNFNGYQAGLVLTPGDHFQLVTNPQERRLDSLPYTNRSPSFTNLRNASGKSRYQLGVHRPILTRESMNIELSLQDVDSKPICKPTAYRVILRPISKQRILDQQQYLIAGNAFMTDKPAPVISISALNWPREATSVQVTCSILEEVIPVDSYSTLAQLKTDPRVALLDAKLVREDPNLLILVQNLGSTSLLIKPTETLISTQTEVDSQNELLITRLYFTTPMDQEQVKKLKFHVLETSQQSWLHNYATPVTVPVDIEDTLKPRTGPFLLR
ncbi:vWA domain-containing protein [Rubinisphaera italica]|uniref:von Willebrand factor type A domain protein n=1 Tax=Rubinisphaera italica TaxID=2527969 RepID=A0A5C5XLJ5_9PLAN|nr:vWA domain-containing protein [Rubinisphaera italica]TWT63321.1 von Willebrand factor type A domain protein [Rubinisphaera italica]